MEKLEARPLIFDDEEIARAGAFVTLDRYGELAVYRGFVRPEDEPREDADVHSGKQAADGQGVELSAGSNVDGIGHGTVITSAGQALGANVPDDEDDGALKPLPERLVMELTAQATDLKDSVVAKLVADRYAEREAERGGCAANPRSPEEGRGGDRSRVSAK